MLPTAMLDCWYMPIDDRYSPFGVCLSMCLVQRLPRWNLQLQISSLQILCLGPPYKMFSPMTICWVFNIRPLWSTAWFQNHTLRCSESYKCKKEFKVSFKLHMPSLLKPYPMNPISDSEPDSHFHQVRLPMTSNSIVILVIWIVTHIIHFNVNGNPFSMCEIGLTRITH